MKSYIEMFSCEKHRDDGTARSLNPDIEHFLHYNAIQFAKMKTAVTYLVIDLEDGALLGYFTLAHKPLCVTADGLSRKVRDQLKWFSKLDESEQSYTVSAFLLAQFGKNYGVEDGKRITGAELMAVAMEQLRNVQNQIGGTLVYLDCEANAGLIRFYEGQNFSLFGERLSENDGKRYLQYLSFV
ncbi:MAG: GNAT family acetyltransferase [Coriobacteriales bacterium]|nr:GNAT family acetyltransferase [Coriobacteriales bacterium]